MNMEEGFLSIIITIIDAILVKILPDYNGISERRIGTSQREFKTVRNYLKENRGILADSAFMFYAKKDTSIDAHLIEDVPLLTKAEWLPDDPIDISKVKISLDKTYKDDVSKNTTSKLTKLLPFCDDKSRFDYYSGAIKALDCPTYFSNNKSYRLIKLNSADKNNPEMVFAYSKYFEHINIGETLGYEYAKAKRFSKKTNKLYRNQLGDPFALDNRHVLPGIITLTIRQTPGAESSFFMHKRGANDVAVGMNTYNVIPAGEFQPSTSSITGEDKDFYFWNNIMREYSEEFLNYEEHYNENGIPVNYSKPPFDAFNKALNEGKARCYYLGFGIDPLSLKGEILTVCIWDAERFDEVFSKLCIKNAEGTLISDRNDNNVLVGIPFNEETIMRYIREEENTPPGIACLKLTLKHKDKLGIE